MNRTEFNNAFWPDFKLRFPNDAQWIAGHQETLKLWFEEVFSGLGIMDCMAVSRSIMNGELEGWAPKENEKVYDRQQIPAIYARHVGRMRYERREAARKAETREQEAYRKRTRPLTEQVQSGEAYRTCRKMTADGASEKEISDFLDSYFGLV